jgi:MoxR-like ATPase
VGPPGIGKTAIVEQVAKSCNIGMVAYTITHHTRQSAIGLPTIHRKHYGKKEYEVTEYTMSEIIASIYDYMEETGHTKGILFIDEINCVSETLAPTMLQFLQYKMFGTHKVPDGWIIVAAGNPKEYNKSVREFDLATLDRVRKIEIEEDFGVWKEYALGHGICESIISYLSIKKEHFYYIENDVEGIHFVTARGWEDLSKLLQAYEVLEIKVEQALVEQFIQNHTIARDFTAYLALYEKYRSDYQVERILKEGASKEMIARAKKANFDERISVIELCIHKLLEEFKEAHQLDTLMREVFRYLKAMKSRPLSFTELEEDMKQKRNPWIEQKLFLLKQENLQSSEEVFYKLKEEFNALKSENEKLAAQVQNDLQHGFDFIKESMGAGQEMVIFVSDLGSNEDSVWYLSAYGNEDFFEYSKSFHFREKEQQLQEEIMQLQQVLLE